MVWLLNERKARQASWCWWNFRERAGRRRQGALTSRGGVRTWCWLSRLPWGCEGAPGGHGTASTHQPCFFSVSRLLVKLMWLLLNCISSGQKRNTKPLHVKMKVLWQCLPLSLSEHRKQRTPFFPAEVTHIFSPTPPFFFYFQSWQPHKNSIQVGCSRDAGRHEWGISCLPGLLSLCAVSAACIISHLVKSELCQPLASGAWGSLSEFCCFSMKKSSFYYCL